MNGKVYPMYVGIVSTTQLLFRSIDKECYMEKQNKKLEKYFEIYVRNQEKFELNQLELKFKD